MNLYRYLYDIKKIMDTFKTNIEYLRKKWCRFYKWEKRQFRKLLGIKG